MFSYIIGLSHQTLGKKKEMQCILYNLAALLTIQLHFCKFEAAVRFYKVTRTHQRRQVDIREAAFMYRSIMKWLSLMTDQDVLSLTLMTDQNC